MGRARLSALAMGSGTTTTGHYEGGEDDEFDRYFLVSRKMRWRGADTMVRLSRLFAIAAIVRKKAMIERCER